MVYFLMCEILSVLGQLSSKITKKRGKEKQTCLTLKYPRVSDTESIYGLGEDDYFFFFPLSFVTSRIVIEVKYF